MTFKGFQKDDFNYEDDEGTDGEALFVVLAQKPLK